MVVVSTKELSNTAEKIGEDWRKLARKLNLSDHDIDAINAEEKKLVDKTYRVFRVWKERAGLQGAKRKILAEALNAIGLKLVAEMCLQACDNFIE